MPELDREFTLDAPPRASWAYLTDMENFASHVPGFQEFEEVDETTSHWTITVDLSKFSREMTFEVVVREEDYPVGRFDLTPMDEPADGSGRVELEDAGGGETTVWFTIETEASGRMAPVLNQIVERALPYIADNFVEDVRAAEIPDAPSH